MPQYKLTYFNIMGRGEPIRLIFAQGGIDYEDNRVTGDAWTAFKPSTPFGQLPVLEVDGKMLAQSGAICTYLAKQSGLNGKDDWEAAKIQELNGGVEDLLAGFRPWFTEKDETKKKEILEKLTNEKIIPFLDRYEKFLADNGTGFFVGNDVTQADLNLFHWLGFLAHGICPEPFKKYAELNKFLAKIGGLPKIAAWLEKRPKTDM
uniref:glutathione transferase n=1 Tax=Plectus sambesii TaxID=2011161 RepID=A0A914VAT3_9BILA